MPKTLLLADDSVTIQKVVGISFANEDIVLLTVDNGDDAISRAREARPDIVLADVVMPGKNGYDVCQAIKAEPALANTPVLLLTGTFEAFDEQRAARVGADGHITKPFEAQALVDKVNALLARPAPGAASDTAGGRPEATPIGAVRTARPPAPPPQPVSHTADTAYDFFDDEITAPREAEEAPREATPRDTTVVLSPPPAEADDPFSLDEPRAGAEAPAPRAPAPADSLGGAFGSDELDLGASSAPGADESSLFDDFEPPAPPAAEEAPAWSVRESAPPAADFGWEAPAEAEPSAPEPAWDAPRAAAAPEAVSFDAGPAAPSGSFDWDLGGDSATETAAPRAEVPDWFAPASPSPDPAATRLIETPARAESFAPSPPSARGFGEFELDAGLGESAAFGDAVSDPRGARDYDVSSSDLGPIAVAPPAPAPSVAARETAPAGGPSPASAASALPERERRELHDALEKLAWEAFGPVAENLVREAVERIERIAWEVIPQLAESLIKEELRKLKGE
jgi:CheY-like chemotaxis protein